MRDEQAPSRIVCAALRFGDGLIIVGPRHWDSTMRATARLLKRVVETESTIQLVGKEEQGFIDQYGRFFTRQEAWYIALRNGQIVRRVGGDEAKGGTLYSENLY